MDDVDGGFGGLGEPHGPRDGRLLGEDGPAGAVVLHPRLARRDQALGQVADDAPVLAVHHGEHPELTRAAHGVQVLRRPPVEVAKDHEDLHARVPPPRQLRELFENGRGRVQQDGVQGEVHQGLLFGLAGHPLRKVQQRFVRTGEGDVADGRDAAGRRRAGPAPEVVGPPELAAVGQRRRGEVDVHVYAARHDELSGRVDLVVGREGAADLHDAPVADGDIGRVLG